MHKFLLIEYQFLLIEYQFLLMVAIQGKGKGIMIEAEEERTINEGWKAAQLKGKAYEEIERLYYNAYRRVHHFEI